MDRDVGEFLDTLKILADHTPEELEALMNSNDENEIEINDDEEEDEDDEDDDVEDDDDDESANLQNGENELIAIIGELAAEGIIDREATSILINLVNNNDERIFGAYDVYKDVEDAQDLIDSLIRIIHVETTKKLPAKLSPAKSNSEMKPSPSKVEVSPSAALLNPVIQRNVVDVLKKCKALEDEHISVLYRLIEVGNPTTNSLFVQYERDEDVQKLVNSLRTLASSYVSYVEDDDEDDDDEDDDDEDDDEEDDDDYDDDYDDDDEGDDDNDGDDNDNNDQYVEQRFLEVVKEMHLTDLDTAALRLAIARDDPQMKNTLESFKSTLNDERLKSDLRSISARTITETLELQITGEDAGENGSDERKTDPADEDEDSDEDDDDYDSEEEDDDDDDDDDDDEQQQAASTPSHIDKQAAREQIFPVLMSELLNIQVISRSDSSILQKLFTSHSPVIHAALDLYDYNGDMAELIDTLQRAAKVSS
jgi:hypothetical protein